MMQIFDLCISIEKVSRLCQLIVLLFGNRILPFYKFLFESYFGIV